MALAWAHLQDQVPDWEQGPEVARSWAPYPAPAQVPESASAVGLMSAQVQVQGSGLAMEQARDSVQAEAPELVLAQVLAQGSGLAQAPVRALG